MIPLKVGQSCEYMYVYHSGLVKLWSFNYEPSGHVLLRPLLNNNHNGPYHLVAGLYVDKKPSHPTVGGHWYPTGNAMKSKKAIAWVIK